MRLTPTEYLVPRECKGSSLRYHGTRGYSYGELDVILRGTEYALLGALKPCVILHAALAVFCGRGARISSAVGSARDYGDSECKEFLVLGLRTRRQKYREWDRGIRHEYVSGLEFSGDGFVLGALLM